LQFRERADFEPKMIESLWFQIGYIQKTNQGSSLIIAGLLLGQKLPNFDRRCLIKSATSFALNISAENFTRKVRKFL
jgi:hypothetical protein